MSKDKVVALVVENADGGLKDVPRWGMVAVTEYYASGKWLTGMVLITSIEEVLDRAEKEKLNIITANQLRLDPPPAKKKGKPISETITERVITTIPRTIEPYDPYPKKGKL